MIVAGEAAGSPLKALLRRTLKTFGLPAWLAPTDNREPICLTPEHTRLRLRLETSSALSNGIARRSRIHFLVKNLW